MYLRYIDPQARVLNTVTSIKSNHQSIFGGGPGRGSFMFQKTNFNKQIACATNSSVTVTAAASQLGRGGREYVLVIFYQKHWLVRDLNSPKNSPKILQNMLSGLLTHFKRGCLPQLRLVSLCLIWSGVVYDGRIANSDWWFERLCIHVHVWALVSVSCHFQHFRSTYTQPYTHAHRSKAYFTHVHTHISTVHLECNFSTGSFKPQLMI